MVNCVLQSNHPLCTRASNIRKQVLFLRCRNPMYSLNTSTRETYRWIRNCDLCIYHGVALVGDCYFLKDLAKERAHTATPSSSLRSLSMRLELL